MHVPIDIAHLAQRFDASAVHAIALMGSYARGEAGPHSDVDLVRFLAHAADAVPGRSSHLIDGRLVMVSDARPQEVEEVFERPEIAVGHIPGLRTALPVFDRHGDFANLQQRAHAFVWDAAMQTRANAWASEQMVGWIEEAHKGLEGLRRNDVGRLLNARFGLSWGLSRVVQVQRGVLYAGDNAFFAAVEAAVGVDTDWARLHRVVFGIENADGSPPTLREQVVAGLRLYITTAELVADALQPGDASLVYQTAARISRVLGQGGPLATTAGASTSGRPFS
ncbi:MAG: nucleotidyltransferase domain-containing protein [Chloroflexales bacterium]|nr:nucleotidyltransferase domain-containing protein [Chloroflexales bacterium]